MCIFFGLVVMITNIKFLKKKIEKNKGLCKFSMMFTVEIYYPFLYTCNSIQISPTVLDF